MWGKQALICWQQASLRLIYQACCVTAALRGQRSARFCPGAWQRPGRRDSSGPEAATAHGDHAPGLGCG